MASTTNYIDRSERLFNESGYLSTVLGDLWTTDATIESDSIVYQDVEFGSLLLKDGSSCSVSYNIWGDPLTDIPSQFSITSPTDNTDHIESFCWVRPTKNCTVNIHTTLTKVNLDIATSQFLLSPNPLDVIVGETGTHTITIGATDTPKWHLVRAMPLQIPDDNSQYSIGSTISVIYDDVASPGQLNVSRPTVIRTHAIFENAFVSNAATYIPEVFLGRDSANFLSNSPTYPLIRMLDVMSNSSNDVFQSHDSIEYMDVSEGFSPSVEETYSSLISPIIADSQTLSWLAQFRGRNLIVTYEPSTEGEEWELFILDESVLDGTDVLASSSIPTTGFSGGVEEYFKWQVEFGYYGHNAGTLAAMISTIKLLLSGSKTISYTMSANSIHFQTSITETFGADLLSIGDSSPYITSILEPTRPLGMVITHELVA